MMFCDIAAFWALETGVANYKNKTKYKIVLKVHHATTGYTYFHRQSLDGTIYPMNICIFLFCLFCLLYVKRYFSMKLLLPFVNACIGFSLSCKGCFVSIETIIPARVNRQWSIRVNSIGSHNDEKRCMMHNAWGVLNMIISWIHTYITVIQNKVSWNLMHRRTFVPSQMIFGFSLISTFYLIFVNII